MLKRKKYYQQKTRRYHGVSRSLRYAGALFGHVLSLPFRLMFQRRKILIISEKKITSVAFNTSLQLGLFAIVLSFAVWAAYSSGKYFAYERMIQEKEQEITDTNLTNKDLLYQVTDLHRNLMRLDTYFQKLNSTGSGQAPGQAAKKASANAAVLPTVKKLKHDKGASLEGGLIDSQDVNAMRIHSRKTLSNINKNISSRVKELETIISLTGLKLEQMADKSYLPMVKKRVSAQVASADTDEADNPQGGPYVPETDEVVSNSNNKDYFLSMPQNLDKKIDYLLHLETIVNKLPLAVPVDNARLSSRFGVRVDPFRKTRAMHQGLDFVGAPHARVYATAPGVVTVAKRMGAYGQLVEIDHGNGIKTRYGHLDVIAIRPGVKVQRGELIGIQGSTGRSTGAHVHYEVRYNNRPYDPEPFVEAGAYVLEESKS